MSFRKTFSVASLFIIGSVVGRMGNLIFRLYAASSLTAVEYRDFAVLLRTFLFAIPFFGFELHSPLTRRVKIGLEDNEELYHSFAWAYRITGIFGLFALSGLVYTSSVEITSGIAIIMAISLLIWGYGEYSVGIARGKDRIKEASIFNSMTGLLRTLFVIVLLIFGLSSVNLFIIGWSLSLIGATFYGIWTVSPTWKYIFSLRRPNFKKLKLNFSEAFKIFIAAFSEQGSLWLITVIASFVLPADTFRIFDLSLVLLSIITIATSNLSLALIQQHSSSNIIRLSKSFRKKLSLMILVVIILSFVSFVVVYLTKIDIYLLEIIGWDVAVSEMFIPRLFLLLPAPMILASISHGLLQAGGSYNRIALFNLMSFTTILFLNLCVYFIGGNFLIPISYGLGKLIVFSAYGLQNK